MEKLDTGDGENGDDEVSSCLYRSIKCMVGEIIWLDGEYQCHCGPRLIDWSYRRC